MDLVTHEPATMLEQDQARSLLLEMAAVVRTIFAVQHPASAAQAVAPEPQVVAVATADTAAFPGASVSAVATSPSLPVPPLEVPSLAMPAQPLPVPGLDLGDPEERHSMALLQEIAFLDE